MEVTLGGERLGSGKKDKIHLHNYERSTHDVGYVWRSTMAPGTLVPFLSELALPGDNWSIDLECDMKTHPTIGPLFGSFKVQLDVFQAPIRLYQGKLHMNMLGIGRDMKNVKLPQVVLQGNNIELGGDIDNQQVNPSSIFSYMNIRGLGNNPGLGRQFNAIPYLAYWDIYKQYYSNKQEEIGYVIHNTLTPITAEMAGAVWQTDGAEQNIGINNGGIQVYTPFPSTEIMVTFTVGTYEQFDLNMLYLWWNGQLRRVTDLFNTYEWDDTLERLYLKDMNSQWWGTEFTYRYLIIDQRISIQKDIEPELIQFPLENIDKMRANILTATELTSAFLIDKNTIAPYGLPMYTINQDGKNYFSLTSNQEGLGIKTYQSDLFNNWISTEWIDGDNGVNEITRVDTSGGSFTIDELNLARKIYNLLNRIAVSGGTYDDWLDVTYTHERARSVENPIYHGGLIKELVFQEVISKSAAEGQPLGELAGRGVLASKNKGGHINIKVDEPSYIIGIISLTPRLDYSQGNKWDTNLKTMDDFHKAELDQIGFQDLITDQLAWWDTKKDESGTIVYKSAGKQPAWVNYMTNVNQVRGNFADASQQMYMVLTRRYEPVFNGTEVQIKDLTTYIDPAKFNHIFADTRRDAQNFWAQIGINITKRAKMSAKVMPNL